MLYAPRKKEKDFGGNVKKHLQHVEKITIIVNQNGCTGQIKGSFAQCNLGKLNFRTHHKQKNHKYVVFYKHLGPQYGERYFC